MTGFLMTVVACLALPLMAASERRLVAGEKASFSPDGTRLVFERLDGHRHKIGLVAVGSQTVEWVYDGPGQACQPAWTPDGSIVFTAGHHTNTAFVARNDPLGYNLWLWRKGEVRRLTAGRVREYAASVAPDGRVYFVSEGFKPEKGATDVYSGNRTGIGRLDVRTGEVTCVAVMKAANAGMVDPVVSPDGQWLARAEVAKYHAPWRLVVSPLDKPDVRTYRTGEDMVAYAPAWSPDGALLAFCGCRRGDDGWMVYVMPATGGAMRKVAKGKNPSFSPDGRTLVYDREGVVYQMEVAP